MTSPNEITKRLIDAALVLAAEQGWARVSLADIATRAELPLLEAYQVAASKAALLCRLVASVDHDMLREGPADRTETVRDRLFDVVMRRFDVLQARRPGMTAILRDLPCDPVSLLCLMPKLSTSFAWMLEAAGLSSAGVAGVLRTKALGAVYLNALRVWLNDDTPDMSRTMAELDKGLRRLERIVCRLPGRPHDAPTVKSPLGEPNASATGSDTSPAPPNPAI